MSALENGTQPMKINEIRRRTDRNKRDIEHQLKLMVERRTLRKVTITVETWAIRVVAAEGLPEGGGAAARDARK